MRQIRSSPQQHGTQPDVETAKAPAARQTRQTTAWAAAGWGEGDDWAAALEGALAQIAPPRQSGRRRAAPAGGAPAEGAAPRRARPGAGAAVGAPDLLCVFATAAFEAHFPPLLARAREATGARVVVGCSGWGVIGGERELEATPAVALLALALPGATLEPVRLTQAQVERAPAAGTPEAAEYWQRLTAVAPGAANAWLLFADPFTLGADAVVGGLGAAFPRAPIVGGLASGNLRGRRTHVFLGGEAFDGGGAAVALGGAWTVETIVSQGCTPIGEPWTITGVDGQQIETIARRPAFEVLADTVRALPVDLARRARGNLFAGLAMDERRATLKRGDFLIRNIYSVSPTTGTLLVGATPELGQTIQFQLRDAAAADEDLRALLDAAREQLRDVSPLAGLLCACTGRGAGLFGAPDHDAGTVQARLGPLPLAGFFCNGEFGPVGGRNFIHGYTASLALFVPAGGERRGKRQEASA